VAAVTGAVSVEHRGRVGFPQYTKAGNRNFKIVSLNVFAFGRI
jgi:hypothetical protein